MEYYKDYREVFPDAPVITDEIRKEIFRRNCSQYVFYKKHKAYADCYCTSCMKRFMLRYDMDINTQSDSSAYKFLMDLAHGSEGVCPSCGDVVTAKAEGKGRGRLYEYCYVSRIFPADNGGTIYIICGTMYSGFGGYPTVGIEKLEQHYDGAKWLTEYIVRLKKGSVETLKNHYHGWQKCQKGDFHEPYAYYNSIYGGVHYPRLDNPGALSETFLKYAVDTNFLKWKSYDGKIHELQKKIRYLMFLAAYPALEMLSKAGGADIIRAIVDNGESYKRVLNLNGKSAAEVFRTDGNTAARIRRLMPSGSITLDTLKCFRYLNKRGRYKIEDAVDLCRISPDYEHFYKMTEKTRLTLRKLLNYLGKQGEAHSRRINGIFQCYCDYINECERLGYDICDTQINRPKDLYAAHQRTASAIRAIEEERLSREDREKKRKYSDIIYPGYAERYEYTDGVFSIIVPKSAEEIVAEGKAMHHCVAGYAERHVNGTLCILFLRYADEPEESLYTIEMHGDKLTQIQGYGNVTPLTPEAKKFFKKWLKWQALPEDKKHPKQKVKSA